MIRLPDLPTVPQQSLGAPAMSAQAAAAPAQALGHVAESIASVSGHFYDHAVKIQRMENARQISEARNSLATAYAQHQIDLQSDLDPASRMEKTRAFIAGAQQFIPSDAPPEVQDQLGEFLSDWSSRAEIHQAEDSSRLSIRRAKQAADNELEEATRNNNITAAHDAIERTAAFTTPEERDKLKANVNRQIKSNVVASMIDANPIESERQLEDSDFLKRYPELDADDQRRLSRYAYQKANQARDDFMNKVIISGEPITEEDLQVMASEGLITPDTHARYALSIRQNAAKVPPAFDSAIYETAYTQIIGYDPTKDETGANIAQLRQWLASQPLPKESISELNDRLNNLLKPETNPAMTKLESDFAAKIGTDFTRGDFGKYRFPVDHDNNPATAPITPINRESYDKAWQLRGQFAEEWRKTLKTLPETATFNDLQNSYNALKQSYRDKKPVPVITPPAVAPITFDPDRAINPTAGNFGGQPIKAPGAFYSGAAATVFGGKNDPGDKGNSAFGGKTGAGGREGAAIPQAVLEASFPGKSKKWLAENVRVLVKTPNGMTHSLPIADLGTAEWVWQKNQRPVIDLTPGAVKQLGGSVRTSSTGKLTGISGLETLDFAVVSTDIGTDFKGKSWDETQDAWWKIHRPHSEAAAYAALTALKSRWEQSTYQTADWNLERDGPKPFEVSTENHKPGTIEVRLLSAAPQNTGEFQAYNVIR